MRLAEQVTSPDRGVRRRAAAAAAELLPLLGLDEGRYAADGTRTGGSPDVEATVAALPADARTAVAVLALAADPALLPSGLPGLGAAVVKVGLGGVTAAVATGGTAVAVGLATGDAGRVVTAGISAAAAVLGQVAAARADRRLARLAELVRAVDDVRRGLPPDAVAVHDRAVADALRRAGADRATADAALDALADVAGRSVPARPVAAVAGALRQRLAGISPPTGPGRAARVGTDPDRAAQLDVPGATTPALRAWAGKAFTGPLVVATVAGVGFAVAAGLGAVAVSAVTVGSLVAAVAAAGVTTAVEHAQARHKAGLEAGRAAVEEARRRARAVAEDAARAAADDRDGARVAAETRAADRLARRLDALLADVAAGARPTTPPTTTDPTSTDPTSTDPTSTDPTTGAGDQLAPGPRTGPLDSADLSAADRARVADLQAAVDAAEASRGRARTAAVARARALAVDLGLASPPTTGADPDALGWPHRRAALEPGLQLQLAALDELPSAVPGPRWALAKGLAGSLLPSVAAAVLGAATLGVAPAVGLAVGPVALAVSAALAERASAVGKQAGKRPGSLWSPAAAAALDAARAQRAAAADAAATDLARQVAENERRQAALAELAEQRAPRPARRRRTATAPPPPTAAAVVDPVGGPRTPSAPAPTTAPARTTPAGKPQLGAALARVAGPVTVVVGGAATVLAVTTPLNPLDALSPTAWQALSAPVVPVAAAAAGAATAAVAALAAAAGEVVAGRSAFDREAARARAADARRTRWTRIADAADRAAEAAEVRARADLDAARADLADARAELDARAVRAHRPGLLQRLLDRAAAVVAAVEAALGRLPDHPDRTGPADATPVDTTPLDTTPLDEAVLARRVEVLELVSPPERAARVQEVVAEARRLGLLDPGPDAARRRTALPAALAAVSAALVGTTAVPGALEGEQFWRWVRTISNATGWWPEEGCPCPPGALCRCPDPVAPRSPAAPEPAATHPSTGTRPPAGARPTAEARPSPPPAPRPARPPLPYAPPPTAAPAPAPAPAPARAPAPAPASAAAALPADVPAPVVDVEVWSGGVGRTLAAVVTVLAPGGASVDLLVRWVDPGRGGRPVLVLSEVPGGSFWWGVPAAVVQAAAQAVAALQPDPAQLDDAVVLGERGGPEPGLAELPVALGGGPARLVPGRGPRQLPAGEAAAATAALRLRPVPDLLGRLRQVLARR